MADQKNVLVFETAFPKRGNCGKSNVMPCEILENIQKQRTENSEAFLDKCIKNDNTGLGGGVCSDASTAVIYPSEPNRATPAPPTNQVITVGFSVSGGDAAFYPFPPLYSATLHQPQIKKKSDWYGVPETSKAQKNIVIRKNMFV